MLTHSEILKQIKEGNILIEPFDQMHIGTNSVDLHLGDTLMVYEDGILDCKKINKTKEVEIPDEGLVLEANKLYLGSSIEYTETLKHVPEIDGKSSLGRLGLFVHMTAGFGDIGYKGHWTFSFLATQSIRIYKGMRVAQLFYFEPTGEITNKYNEKGDAKYRDKSSKPAASKMYMNFDKEGNSN